RAGEHVRLGRRHRRIGEQRLPVVLRALAAAGEHEQADEPLQPPTMNTNGCVGVYGPAFTSLRKRFMRQIRRLTLLPFQDAQVASVGCHSCSVVTTHHTTKPPTINYKS